MRTMQARKYAANWCSSRPNPKRSRHWPSISHGAAGIVSYAQNQRTAWWGENADLLRWGHLDSFAGSPRLRSWCRPSQARDWQARLAAGETVRLQARSTPASTRVRTTSCRRASPAAIRHVLQQEIAFTCHLDHPHPGANDNASGCATILEVARTFAKLIREGTLPRPARTLHFLWPPEIEGTTILLNARPDLAERIVAAIHMDMVGGGPETKAVFHVTRSPASLPTFVNDVAETIAEYVNAQTLAHASGETATYPLMAPEGGKEPLLAQSRRVHAGQRSRRSDGRRVPDSIDLSQRLAGPLHPYRPRCARQHRSDEAQACGLHRCRRRLVSR